MGKTSNSISIFQEKQEERQQLVDSALRDRDIHCPKVLAAMERIPRHFFVPEHFQNAAYRDHPLPIALDQTISQPYIVAAMTQALQLTGTETVLEIGTGSGYQTAVLAEIVQKVYSVEIHHRLTLEAQKKLEQLGYDNIEFRTVDGYDGWPQQAPFDAIIVTAAPPKIPKKLIHQLKDGGRMIIPVGSYQQDLLLIHKEFGDIEWDNLMPVVFVPMTGKAQQTWD